VEESTHRLTRREFLAGAAAGAATIAAGGLASRAEAATAPSAVTTEGPWIEASIPELQAMMASGELTSTDLTNIYLARIAEIDPLLHSVIETNPQALSIAGQRDRERRAGQVRGPLHGIPILLKDNIATDDRMQTTAGSLALVEPGPCRRTACRQASPGRGRGARQGQPVGMGELPRRP
jgi:amidase